MSENQASPNQASPDAGVASSAGSSAWQFDFTGRKVVVTGGSRGLGLQMATAFSELGAEVAIASRKIDSCRKAAEEITARTGNPVRAYALQVSDWDQCTAFASQVWDDMGGVDVLVNNAGSSPLYESLSGISEELYDKVIGLNLKGPFRLGVLIGERMAGGDPADAVAAAGTGDGPGGAIINISSIASINPRPDVVPYAAAKAGLNATTTALARAFGPSVRVNCVVPGTFLTDVSTHWDMEAFGKRAEAFASKRGGQPEEIVGAVLYLASPLSSYTTGTTLVVDGGASS